MRMRSTARAIFFAMLPLVSAPSFAAECTVHSGPRTAALVELYTSEGCSSCPPADQWLSKTGKTGDRPHVPPGGTSGLSLVPIAFHIVYWDYLGWKDTFGDMRYTERQRQFARVAGATSVYTPQVVVAGRDFPDWRSTANVTKAIGAVNSRPARANVEIATQAPANARVRASLAPGVRADDLALVVAITESGLMSRVKAGENRGETLRHDFVVRDMVVAPALTATANFAPRADWNLERMGVVAFVQNTKTGEVLQALSAPLCR